MKNLIKDDERVKEKLKEIMDTADLKKIWLEKYKIVLKKAGIPLYTFHALRHTFATRCVEQGMDIKTLSEIMGHSNVSITMQRYVHPSLEMKREQINRLSNVIISGHEMGQTQQESPHL